MTQRANISRFILRLKTHTPRPLPIYSEQTPEIYRVFQRGFGTTNFAHFPSFAPHFIHQN
jgi:hypothetical protein